VFVAIDTERLRERLPEIDGVALARQARVELEQRVA